MIIILDLLQDQPTLFLQLAQIMANLESDLEELRFGMKLTSPSKLFLNLFPNIS
jgi:hypothetical protein